MSGELDLKVIDLRSDTVTQPSDAMRQAMFDATVGDDVYDEDPTVNSLQERAAKLLGKEAALFVSSGTMGNLISLLVHCQRGEQAIIGEHSHINIWEQNGASALGGISLRTIPTNDDGTMAPDKVARAINPDNIHCARTRTICLENTWNGHVLPLSYMSQIKSIAAEHNLSMHLDGARMFNASVALGVTPDAIAQSFDSVQFCFSKGLAAPIGSMVCGSASFIVEAKRMRKVLGGAMRQVGVIAAACHVSMDEMIDRLGEDHETAEQLASGLSNIRGIKVNRTHNTTNMVFLDSDDENLSWEKLQQMLQSQGILCGIEPRLGIRLVTHYGISKDDIDDVLARIAKMTLKSSSPIKA